MTSKTSKSSGLPKGWSAKRVADVAKHYTSQSEESAVAEDEAAYVKAGQTLVSVPNDLLPKIRRLITQSAKTVATAKPTGAVKTKQPKPHGR